MKFLNSFKVSKNFHRSVPRKDVSFKNLRTGKMRLIEKLF